MRILREGEGVTEGVGEPAGAVVDAEFLFEEAVAVEVLADHGFAGGHVGVLFDPTAAEGFPATFGDALLDGFEDVGVVVL